jgi:hypothetical protein
MLLKRIARRRYHITELHECDVTKQIHEDDITKQNRAKAPPHDNSKQQSSHSFWSLLGSSFTEYPIRISSSKMTSRSLRPIPVEGEYCLFTNNLCIHGGTALGAVDKICAASFFAELPLRLFDLILDVPRMSFNKSFLPSRLEGFQLMRLTSCHVPKHRGYAQWRYLLTVSHLCWATTPRCTN